MGQGAQKHSNNFLFAAGCAKRGGVEGGGRGVRGGGGAGWGDGPGRGGVLPWPNSRLHMFRTFFALVLHFFRTLQCVFKHSGSGPLPQDTFWKSAKKVRKLCKGKKVGRGKCEKSANEGALVGNGVSWEAST